MSSDERDAPKFPGTVEIARLANLFEAQHLAGLLEGEGIPTHIPGQNMFGTYDGAAVIWDGGIRLMVPADREIEARDILLALEARRQEGAAEGDGDESTEG